MYKATVIKIFIASPGDVQKERVLIREAISEWNSINAFHRKIILQPIGWEVDSYPVTGDRAQAILNEEILKDADLLIGIFWTRIGTPTGENPSGTVEEIKEHISEGKPASLYFSDQPFTPSEFNIDQYEKLKDFRKWIQANNKGLYATYNSEIEFFRMVSRQLSLLINTHQYFSQIQEEIKASPIKNVIKAIPKLSEDAKLVLRELAKDNNGSLYKIYRLGGFFIQVNGKSLGSAEGDPKQRAALDAAIDELETESLIKQKDFEGKVFEITKKGYEWAEEI